MKLSLICAVILSVTSLTLQNFSHHPLSDEFIDYINSKQLGWKAGRNFHVNTSMDEIRRLIGRIRTKSKGKDREFEFPIKQHSIIATPEIFDAREEWPECDSIRKIWNQGDCASTWAIAPAAVISDRICIVSKGVLPITVSVEDLLSCFDYCNDVGTSCGCEGYYVEIAWQQWLNKGIVTGGDYGSGIGCKSYTVPPCDIAAPRSCVNGTRVTHQCVLHCDSNSKRDYFEDLTTGLVYQIPPLEEQIKTEIMVNGPVVSVVTVYEDFLSYKSGVYRKTVGDSVGLYTVKILGWGIEDNVPFWLAASSWGTTWGEGGYFKILRGRNECNIEIYVMSAHPIL